MRNPSGICGVSSMSKSDFAFTVAVLRLSATIEIRSSVACALSLGLVRKMTIQCTCGADEHVDLSEMTR